MLAEEAVDRFTKLRSLADVLLARVPPESDHLAREVANCRCELARAQRCAVRRFNYEHHVFRSFLAYIIQQKLRAVRGMRPAR